MPAPGGLAMSASIIPGAVGGWTGHVRVKPRTLGMQPRRSRVPLSPVRAAVDPETVITVARWTMYSQELVQSVVVGAASGALAAGVLNGINNGPGSIRTSWGLEALGALPGLPRPRWPQVGSSGQDVGDEQQAGAARMSFQSGVASAPMPLSSENRPIVSPAAGLAPSAVWENVRDAVAGTREGVEGSSTGSSPMFGEAEVLAGSPALFLLGLNAQERQRLLLAVVAALQAEVMAIPPEAQQETPTQWMARSRGTVGRCAVAAAAAWMDAAPGSEASEAAQLALQGPGGGGVAQSPGVPVAEALKALGLAQADASEVERGMVGQRAGLYAAAFRFVRFPPGELQEAAGRSTGPRTPTGVAARHANVVLMDVAVAAAEAVSAAYLATVRAGARAGAGGETRFDGRGAGGGAWADEEEVGAAWRLHPQLDSTRALERFRNQVGLRRWLQDSVLDVACMYEDRQVLWALGAGGRPQRVRVRMRRARDLEALSGWRLGLSLLLEASDVAGPLLQAVAAHAGDALSFLLVQMIGRALGLVYRGVKQSVARGGGDAEGSVAGDNIHQGGDKGDDDEEGQGAKGRQRGGRWGDNGGGRGGDFVLT